MFPSRQLFLVLGALSLACINTSATRTGTQRHSALASDTAVTVFASEADVQGKFTTLAIMNHHDAGKYQNLTLEDAIPALKAKARSVGANGLIIDHQAQVISGLVSRGIEVRARAIRFAPPSSQAL